MPLFNQMKPDAFARRFGHAPNTTSANRSGAATKSLNGQIASQTGSPLYEPTFAWRGRVNQQAQYAYGVGSREDLLARIRRASTAAIPSAHANLHAQPFNHHLPARVKKPIKTPMMHHAQSNPALHAATHEPAAGGGLRRMKMGVGAIQTGVHSDTGSHPGKRAVPHHKYEGKPIRAPQVIPRNIPPGGCPPGVDCINPGPACPPGVDCTTFYNASSGGQPMGPPTGPQPLGAGAPPTVTPSTGIAIAGVAAIALYMFL